MGTFAVVFLLFVAAFAWYAISSSNKRVAKGGPRRHPNALRSTYINAISGSLITLSDGKSYLVTGGNISDWRIGHEAWATGGGLQNMTIQQFAAASEQ